MPRPSIDFAIDAARTAAGEHLINVLASGAPKARYAIYVSGDRLPDEVEVTARYEHSRFDSHIYEWPEGVTLIGCDIGCLHFLTPGGERVCLPLVHPESPESATGVRELIITLL